MCRFVLTGIIPLVVLARPALAQGSGSIDFGTAFLDQPTIGSSNVLTAAGELSYVAPRGLFTANGLAARTPNDLYTGQAVATAAAYAPPLRFARWELAATGSTFGVSGVAPSFGWQLAAREHLGSQAAGVFAGVAAGGLTAAGLSRRVLGASGGGFVRLGATSADELSGALAYTNVASAAGSGAAVGYADLFGYWQHRAGPIELLFGGGARTGTAGSLGTSGWASGAATVWLMPRLAVVVAGGRALADPTRAVPAVRYLSLAFRVGERQSQPLAAMPVRHPDIDRGDGHLDVSITTDSMCLVTVRADTATLVELMADFTDWEPVSLTRLPNGSWGLERAIAPGVHHVAIRLDGGPWHAPPNLTRAPDEFGGEIGLLAVP